MLNLASAPQVDYISPPLAIGIGIVLMLIFVAMMLREEIKAIKKRREDNRPIRRRSTYVSPPLFDQADYERTNP